MLANFCILFKILFILNINGNIPSAVVVKYVFLLKKQERELECYNSEECERSKKGKSQKIVSNANNCKTIFSLEKKKKNIIYKIIQNKYIYNNPKQFIIKMI